MAPDKNITTRWSRWKVGGAEQAVPEHAFHETNGFPTVTDSSSLACLRWYLLKRHVSRVLRKGKNIHWRPLHESLHRSLFYHALATTYIVSLYSYVPLNYVCISPSDARFEQGIPA